MAQLVGGSVIVGDSRALVHRRRSDRALFPGCRDPRRARRDWRDAVEASPARSLRRPGRRLRRVIAELGEASWTGDDGSRRREIDYLVEGDLDSPRLEQPHARRVRLGRADELGRLMENCPSTEALVREIVARGLRATVAASQR